MIAVNTERWAYDFVHDYLSWCKPRLTHCRTYPEGSVRMSWPLGIVSVDDWRRRFRQALNLRINLKAGHDPDLRGRKADYDYQWRLRRDSDRVRANLTGRVIVRQFETVEARERFAHLLFTDD